MSELLEKYGALKQELIRVRDAHRLHSLSTQDRECREEDTILDEMDIVWHKMSNEEHKELDGGWDCCCGSLNYMAREIAKWSEGKGWETNWRNVPEKLMLVVTELAEAMECYRNFSQDDIQSLDASKGKVDFSTDRPTDALNGFRREIADAVIRLLNLSASLGIDIETEIAAKMEINEKRPFKHGGKNC
jgi:NTP pyrophosphatase (non-canonical NTP hydrolase)